jgi:LuxR family quorum-sensing system transcriptional regulator CciR
MRISDFIEQSNQMDSPAAILALMERAAGDLGFDRYAYCALTRRERYDVGGNPAPAVALNYPTSWTDYYFEHNYPAKDPVLLYTPEIENPFLWDWLSTAFRLDRAQRTVMQQAREAGLKDGVGVPLHGPQGNVCLVSFAAGNAHPGPAAELRKLGVLAAQFHAAYSEIGRTEIDRHSVAALSERERECLQWIANGKSSWDVGRILNISEYTVNYHVRNTFRKLDTNSRIAAVVKAIRYGLINL